MAKSEFNILKMTDAEVVEAFKSIAEKIGAPDDSKLTFFFPEQQDQAINVNLADIGENEQLTQIKNSNAPLFKMLRIEFSNINQGKVQIDRRDLLDTASIHYNNDVPNTVVASILCAVSEQIKIYGSKASLRELIGEDLTDFYSYRDQVVSKLEQTNLTITKQMAEYRHSVDLELEQKKKKVEEEYTENQAELENEHATKLEKLKEFEDELERRAKDLDDRDNKHARRKIREEGPIVTTHVAVS